MELPIYNCHIHTFTAAHIPDRFLPLGLNKILKVKFIRRTLINLLVLVGRLAGLVGFLVPSPVVKAGASLFKTLYEWYSKISSLTLDTLMRYDRFFETSGSAKQSDIFNRICPQYPEKTRFIVLPMDMEFMGAGKPAVLYEGQISELAALRDELDRNELTRGQIIPFCAVDPRRENVVSEFKRWLKEYRLRGVKLYPNLGYLPNHEVLLKIYDICQSEKIPVLAHCSTGGIRAKGLSNAEAAAFAHPANYEPVLKQFKKLNFCLAHFGGVDEWERQIMSEAPRKGEDASWLTVITDLMKTGEYPNLYTDIAYTLFCESPRDRPFNYFDYLKVMLNEERVREHVLFGTDFYMVQLEKSSDKEISIALRAHLGEELYSQLAHHNPMKFLYEVTE